MKHPMVFGPNLTHEDTPPFLSTISTCTLPFCSRTSTSNHFDSTPKLPFLALLLTPTKPSPSSSTLVSPSCPSSTRRSPRSLPSLSPSLTLTLSLALSPIFHPICQNFTFGMPDDGKQQSNRLPLPLITISNPCPFSPTYSTSTTPSVPQSPGRAENPISPGSRWKKGRLIGRGTFGHVYLGFNSESGEMCAMKEVTFFSDDAKSKESAQQLGQEISLLSRLSHPNIVQYYGSETVDDKLYIYSEYVSGGSIYKLLQEYGRFGEIAFHSYTQEILSGLAYLHAKNTVHRDIKGANILVDPNGHVKLADFGMAKHITGRSCPLSFKGSPYWMAPEVIKNSNGCNLVVDLWTLGCTVLEMATTKPPWSQYEGVAAMFKIGNSKELPTIPDHLSEEGKDFVRQCLQRNPLHRPTAARLLEHPFVRNAVPLERPSLSSEPEPPPAVTNAVRSMGIGHTRNVLESEGVAIHQSRGSKTGSGSRHICSFLFLFIIILSNMGTVHAAHQAHFHWHEKAKSIYILLIVVAISVALLICYFILRLCKSHNINSYNELDNQIGNIELTGVQINLFHISRFSEHEMYLECIICLDAFADGDEIIILPVCRHIYHTHCITSWFTSHSHCPLCRHDYSGYSLDD